MFHSESICHPGTVQGRAVCKGLKREILRRSDGQTPRSRLPLAISARGVGGQDAQKAYFTGLVSGAIFSGAVFFSQQVDAATRGPLLTRNEMSTVRMFKDNTSSVVNITNLAVRQDEFTSEFQEVPQGAGSGFIWDDQGHIVTNFHVLLNAADVRVTLSDQSVHQAKFIGGDADKDVAVIQIETDSETPLKPIKVGLSAGLEVGQNVYAIGNPFGLDHTLTTGIISV
ncbi:protease Do-like, partial [Cymbomonas tetramitiformis]